MGAGDVLAENRNIIKITAKILETTLHSGVFRFDISTVLPERVTIKVTKDLASKLYDMYWGSARVFYSLFSVVDETRHFMMPGTHRPEIAIEILREFSDKGIPVYIHQIFIDGVNDSDDEVDRLIEFVTKHDDVIRQLRILRYNECYNSWWFESSNYDSIVARIQSELPRSVELKLQVSPGKEIKAACGMFE
jgi:adenine C2-methylase RlmN of 23S rRNA A2503 and tRNA A37